MDAYGRPIIPMGYSPQEGSNTGLIIGIILVVIIVLIAAGVGIYFALKSKSVDGTKKMYNFYQGKDIGGYDLIPPSPYKAASVSDLLKKCNDTPGCIAANTNGWIKNSTTNFFAQPVFSSATQGVYVLATSAGNLGDPTSKVSERFRGARNH